MTYARQSPELKIPQALRLELVERLGREREKGISEGDKWLSITNSTCLALWLLLVPHHDSVVHQIGWASRFAVKFEQILALFLPRFICLYHDQASPLQL
jgi:hypothetical protein